MRNRMRSLSSSGSTWMSLARSRIAWLTMRLTSWTIGCLVVEVDLACLGRLLRLIVGQVERLHQTIDVGVGAVAAVDERADRAGVADSQRIGCWTSCSTAARRSGDGSADSMTIVSFSSAIGMTMF